MLPLLAGRQRLQGEGVRPFGGEGHCELWTDHKRWISINEKQEATFSPGRKWRLGLEIEMKREETERAEILKMEKVGEWKIGTLHSCFGKNVHGITMYCTGEASRVTSKATAGARR